MNLTRIIMIMIISKMGIRKSWWALSENMPAAAIWWQMALMRTRLDDGDDGDGHHDGGNSHYESDNGHHDGGNGHDDGDGHRESDRGHNDGDGHHWSWCLEGDEDGECRVTQHGLMAEGAKDDVNQVISLKS